MAADGDRYLRVRVTYTDSFGSDKTAQTSVPNVVIVHRLSSLTMTGLSALPGDREFYPDFDQDTLHYAARCSDAMTLTLTAQASDTRIAVNGVQQSGASAISLAGLPLESDIEIKLTGAAGGSTTYFVHCLDRDQFPRMRTTKSAGALEDLLVFSVRLPRNAPPSWLVMLDNNGVPRLRYRVFDAVGAYFRAHPDESHPHARYSFEKRGESYLQHGAEMVVLDRYFNVIDDEIHIKSPFNSTNPHDQLITPAGNYVLMAYSWHRRDLRFLEGRFPEIRGPDGALKQNEQVFDSAIQVQKPGGQVLFSWSSWDHMALEDCLGNSFTPEYAHLNYLELVDGDLLAGFRGCSKILRIDMDTGDVIWRTGPSIYTREQWQAGETLKPDRGPAPLDFVNDPKGGFSGQHGGHLTPEETLLVYDNASHCLIPPGLPADVKGVTQCSGELARAVEYALDTPNGELVHLREFVMPATVPPRTDGGPGGHAESMSNGDWLISWSDTSRADDPAPMPNTAMQVDPKTGTPKLTLIMQNFPGVDTDKPDDARITVISPVALAERNQPLEASFPASEHSDVFHTGATDSPQIVVAFNRPVVDFDETSPSLSVTGATVASVSAHVVAGEPANTYLITLTPESAGSITLTILANQACDSGGICAADGTLLTDVPSAVVIGPPPSVTFERATQNVREGSTVTAYVRLSTAHQGVRGVTVPILLDTSSTASTADLTAGDAVTFEAGETRQSIELQALDDDFVEGIETADLTFGALPDSLTTGTIATSPVTVVDADQAQISFERPISQVQVAEGNSFSLSFTITNGLSFERDQNITLAVGGTATQGDDFIFLDARSLTPSTQYAVTFLAGDPSTSFEILVIDDNDVETVGETISMSATLDLTGASLGTRTVTIPPSDVPDTPIVTISGDGAVTEGESAAFTLSRTVAIGHPITDPLTVSIRVTADSSTLGGSGPSSATFQADEATVTVEVATLDDAVVEPAGAVTVLVLGGTGAPPPYLVGAANAAAVTVEDNDTAAFSVEASADEVAEGGAVTITVTGDGVTFAEPQTIELTLAGTATVGDDFTVSGPAGELAAPYMVTLPRVATSVVVTLKTLRDDVDDVDETVEAAFLHEGVSIGAGTITIGPPAPVVITTGGGGGGGAPAVPVPSDEDFDWNVTRDIEELHSDQDSPTGMWSDGQTLWVLDNAASGADHVFAYDLTTGEPDLDKQFELDRRNRFSHGLWSDGETFWVADSGQDRLFGYVLETGVRDEQSDIELAEDNKDPRGIWADDGMLYVLDSVKDALFVYDFESGELLAEHALDTLNKSSRGIWSDGVTFWVSDDGAKRLFAYEFEDGELVRNEDLEFTFRSLLKGGNSDPRGIWSDGEVMYVADEQDDHIYTYNMPDAVDARLASITFDGVELEEFSPNTTEYRVRLDAEAQTWLLATPAQSEATFTIEPAGQQTDPERGHEIALAELDAILVTVTSSDGSRIRTYRIDLERPSCLSGLTEEQLSVAQFVGGSVADLETCLTKLNLAGVFHYQESGWTSLFLDAPAFLSDPLRSRFAQGIAPGESFVVKRSASPADAGIASVSN